MTTNEAHTSPWKITNAVSDGVEGERHAHASRGRLQFDDRRHIVRLDTRDEVGQVDVRQPAQRDDLGKGDATLLGERHPRLLHEFHLGRVDRRHRVEELASGAEVELAHRHGESTGSPPRFDAVLRRPQIPHVLDIIAVDAFEGDALPWVGRAGASLRALAHDVLRVRRERRRARCLRARAAPNASRRPTQSARYCVTQASSSRNGSGRSE